MPAADYQLREYVLQAICPSLGTTPRATYAPVPFDGELIETRVSPDLAINTADCTITIAKLPLGVAANAVNIGGTITIPVAGAAAGTVAVGVHSGANRFVNKGDVIRITPAGASGAGVNGNFTMRIRR